MINREIRTGSSSESDEIWRLSRTTQQFSRSGKTGAGETRVGQRRHDRMGRRGTVAATHPRAVAAERRAALGEVRNDAQGRCAGNLTGAAAARL
jgi:hypothetical protein